MNRVGHLKDTHNYYMKAIVETGTIGIVLILSIIWKFFRMSWTLYRRATDPLLNSLGLGMAACTICIFIVNFFGDRWTFVEINGIVWVAFGLVAVGNNLLDQPAEEAAPAEKVEMETPGYLQPAYR
jgi:O-antigen ligase